MALPREGYLKKPFIKKSLLTKYFPFSNIGLILITLFYIQNILEGATLCQNPDKKKGGRIHPPTSRLSQLWNRLAASFSV